MLLTCLGVALLGLTSSLFVVADPVVQVGESGISYRGTIKDSIEHFQNIKFAHDTSGTRRFAPPEPYSPPDGSEVDATAPGPACPQSKAGIPPFFAETPDISEDCLHLRIARPAGTTTEDRLPVIVWLHGGGVVKGSAYDPHFDPDNIIKLSTSIQKPVIYVSLNYRLTIFGFANLPTLYDQKSLNVGMRDQRAGFQWVKDNIASFGGDPDSITVFGLSSGGTFISLQTLAYGGEKGVPFTKAWAMSGPPGTALNITSDASQVHTLAVAERLGCQTEDEKDILKCLREVPMEKLTEAAMDYSVANHPPAGLFTFIPSVDGDFIPDRHTVLYKAGKFTKGIPMVFGWTQDDGATNAGPAASFQTEEDIKTPIEAFAHALTTDDYERLFSLYPISDFEEDVQNYEASKAASEPDVSVHFFRASRILRDILFTCSSIDFGYEMSRQSRVADPTFPGVRLYDLNQSMLTPLFKGAGMSYIRVAHGSDTNYIFDGVFPEGAISDEDQKLSKSMATTFINFAYSGDPTSAEDEHFSSWPEAFPDPEKLDESPSSTPSSFNVHVIGGPLGSGSCQVSSDRTDAYAVGQDEEFQQPLVDSARYTEMASKASQARKREVDREKLVERCAFISTLSEKLGV
ncbi:alpha/beta-hydrolase [Hypoxylon cercidicola]|nr:alpha/beta-hydrolase [Hypoxylon cercidicola]